MAADGGAPHCGGVVRNFRNGVYVNTAYGYQVIRDDGIELALNGESRYSGEVWVLGERIARETNKVRLPRALTAIQEGQRLDFGPLSIDLDHIFDGSDALPWREVEDIAVQDGKLMIKRLGRWMTWSKTSVGAIPDLDVLLALAHALHKVALPAG